MKRSVLYFIAPRQIEIRSEEMPLPEPGGVAVRTLVSAISAGTELLLYRGEVGEKFELDEALGAIAGKPRFPFRYGYAAVGETADSGKRVFAFQPHATHFTARDENLHALPDELPTEAAAFLPTVETAVNLVLDARPLVGERVLVVGQGVVGLVTTALLARFPLSRLWTVEPIEHRRELSRRLGAERSIAPDELDGGDFDLTIELSGTPSALDLAIQATGFEGRVVVGSWYGDGKRGIELGTHFHRGRIQLLSSQVSHVASALSSRWSKSRRLELAWKVLLALPVVDLISHRFRFEVAAEAYRLLDERPEECLQVLLEYRP